MIGVNSKVLDILRKVRIYLEDGKMDMDNFPLESILEIIENTMGTGFWACIGSVENDAFKKVPNLYKEWFEEIVQNKDIKGCIRLLELFENSYKSLYTSINDSEKEFREKPYRKMILECGKAYVNLQYRLHQERQKDRVKVEKKLAVGKGVVYTCVFGDMLAYQPLVICEELDYICFTDNEAMWGKTDGVWYYAKLENQADENFDSAKLCTKYKILAPILLEQYDFSIWTEHSMQIVGDILQFAKGYGDGYSFLGFALCNDDCIYNDERKISMSADYLSIAIRKGMYQYKEEGYPEHYGLIDAHVMVRSHRDSDLNLVMQEWWNELKKYEGFGDDCFNYAAWKHNFSFALCDLFSYSNIYFKNMDIDLEVSDD